MNLKTQVAEHILICPRTGQPLMFDASGSTLVTQDQGSRYRLLNGQVPVLLLDEDLTREYINSSKAMDDITQGMAVKYGDACKASSKTASGRV